MATSAGISSRASQPPRLSWPRGLSNLINGAVVLSVPLAAVLASEGVLRPMLPVASGLGLLWLTGGVQWLLGARSGWGRLLHPLPIAAGAVLVLSLFGRVAEVPFHLSESALESHALALIAEEPGAVTGCAGDDVQRFGVVFATVTCFPGQNLSGQVDFKTSVRPAEKGGTQITGFVYVADPDDAVLPYVYGPCDWTRLSTNFHKYSCWQFGD